MSRSCWCSRMRRSSAMIRRRMSLRAAIRLRNVFVALNHPKYALFFSLLRKIILVAPLTLLLPYTGMGVMAPFWAETISQVIGATACFTTMCFKVWRPLMLGRLYPGKEGS